MPERDLELLLDAAKIAGDIALKHWKSAPDVWEKPGGAGPVTEADLAVNDALAGLLRKARPAYGWLSEESEDSTARLEATTTFLIDPIDGTRAFIAGESTFAHALATVERGAVTAAVVYLPALDLMFAATRGGEATLNGSPIVATTTKEPNGATILTARANLAPEHWSEPLPDLKRVFRASMAYRLCLVAQGRFDAALTLRPSWEWDIAAGDLICQRAGAAVTDRFGAAIRYNAAHPQSAGVLAAPKALHKALLSHMRPAKP